jgi:hypothetical protein
VATGWYLGLGRFRNARAQGAVRASAIVVIRPFPKDAAEVAFAQRDEVVQTLPANCADETLAECVRLWAADWGLQGAHTKARQGGIEVCRECRAVVVEDEAVGMAAGKRFAELLQGAFAHPAWPTFAHLIWPTRILLFCPN